MGVVYMNPEDFSYVIKTEDSRYDKSYFEVDEFIAPIIQILNRKGFRTKYCCSGHAVNTLYKTREGKEETGFKCYIYFEDAAYIPFLNLSELSNFELDLHQCFNPGFLLEKMYECEEDDRYINILETMIQLHNWALKLPNFKLY